MSDAASNSDDGVNSQPDPDLVIPDAHLASEEFVQFVIVTLESSAFIDVEKLTTAGGGCDLLLTEVDPNEQS